MTLFLLEDRDFKSFWMKIWNAGVSVITRSTFSSLSSYPVLPMSLDCPFLTSPSFSLTFIYSKYGI